MCRILPVQNIEELNIRVGRMTVMPKVTVRKDGTWFTQAVVTPGSALIRTWEVKREGIEWLRRQGIQVGQEMGRTCFHELLKLGYAYIAKRSGATVTTTPPLTTSEVRQSRFVSGRGLVKPSEPSMPSRPPQQLVRNHGLRPQPSVPRQPAPAPESATLPAHLSRRSKKKDWFT